MKLENLRHFSPLIHHIRNWRNRVFGSRVARVWHTLQKHLRSNITGLPVLKFRIHHCLSPTLFVNSSRGTTAEKEQFLIDHRAPCHSPHQTCTLSISLLSSEKKDKPFVPPPPSLSPPPIHQTVSGETFDRTKNSSRRVSSLFFLAIGASRTNTRRHFHSRGTLGGCKVRFENQFEIVREKSFFIKKDYSQCRISKIGIVIFLGLLDIFGKSLLEIHVKIEVYWKIYRILLSLGITKIRIIIFSDLLQIGGNFLEIHVEVFFWVY